MGEMGSVEIVIKGGRPWGFTLQGGAESRSAVTVAQIEPLGKADLQGSLKVGDHVLKINDVQCFSLADATQLIDCAFRTLTVHIWRSKSAVSVPNDIARENYRNNNSKNHYRQRHTEDDDTYIRRISSPVNSSYHASYSNLSMVCKDIPQTQNLMSPCHSHQPLHEWVQYDRREMSSLENIALSSQDSSVHSLATDTSVASSATVPQDHYEVSDSCNRHLRSPRNLTKDSGYETCAQTEHDYVNLEWLANSPFPKGNTPVLSPQGYPMTTNADVYSSNERLLSHHGRSSSLASEKYSYQSSSTGSISFPYNDYTDPCAPSRNFSTPSSKYSESYNNLYSSTESLSSRASKPESVHLRSSKSSLSLIHDSRSHAYDHQQVLTSCQYSFVSPAQSTPNLNYYDKMVPRRTTKRPSVYEELASKSGFDFSPMIQHPRLPFQKAVAKEEAVVTDSYLSYANKPSANNFASFPENCDKINAHTLCKQHNESFPNENQILHKSKVPASVPPPVPASVPPPVPARDSSLRYRTASAHEKFPSWPVALPVEMEMNYSSVHSSGYRSSSWTEQTDCVKDFDGSYSRPKDNFQISTQHLHPVQERSQKSINNQTTAAKNSPLTEDYIQYSNKDESPAFDMCFNMLSKHLDSESSYQKCEKYVNDHSPPERDTITPVPLQNEEALLNYGDKYDSDEYFEQSSNLYENVKRNGSHYHSTTPLLDRLRLERKGLPDSCPSYQDLGPKSETATYVSSNSSSQETLKRHNSFSDLSSVHTFTRNDSPSLESETFSTHDENFNKGFKNNNLITCSTEYVSPSKVSSQSNKAKLYPWPKSNTAPYVVTEVICERKTAVVSIPEIEKIQQELRYKRRNLLFGDVSYRHDNVTENENSKEKPSLPSYPHSRISLNELNSIESKVIKPSHLYSSVQNEKKVNANNTTVTQSPQTVHCDKAAHHVGGRSQYRRTTSVPESLTPRYISNSRHHYHHQHHEPLVVYSKNDNTENSENGNKFNQNLKNLQKQAVLSFYHRQTTMASKDFAEKKSRSSSFSHVRETSMEHSFMPVSPPPIAQRRRVRSSNSFSQPLSQMSACKSTSVSPNYENLTRELQLERRLQIQEKPTLKTFFSSRAEKYSNEHHDSSSVSASITTKQEEHQSSRKPDVREGAHSKIAPLTQECKKEREASNKRIADKLPQQQAFGRKALFQKTYSSNKSAVVKVISSDGETLAQNVITKNAGKSVSKPQVPPKRIHKAISVPPALLDNSLFGHNIPIENCEEEELLNIEMCHVVLPPKSISSSPELPLPPPPQNTGHGIINEDDSFPPPPDPLDISFKGSECSPKYCNPKVSTIVMEEENTQFCPLAFQSISKVMNDVSACKDQEGEISNFPIKTSPIEKSSQRVPLQSGAKTVSSIPVNYELNTLINVYENEAIYVNLPFQADTCEKPATSSVSTPFSDAISSISVTNIGTQTSEDTPTLQRRNKISYLTNKYEDKESIVSTVKEQIKLSMPSEKNQLPVTMSYNTNEIHTAEKMKPHKNDTDNFNFHSSTSVDILIDKNTKPLRDKVSLPVTCPYFTSSEPKAKLLTKYYHSLHSNWINHADIKEQKEDLVASISKKLNIMRLEQIKIREEMEQNEELGKDIRAKIDKLAKPSEIEKYRVHVDESEKIVHILLSLSGRLTRAQNALHILPKEQSEEKSMLEAKKNKLSQQLDEALQLKENIDRRCCQVSLFLSNYLSNEDYADYEHFIQMKPKLLVDSKEIDDNIKLGEEQLSALHGTFQENHVNRELVNTNGDLTVLDGQ